MNINHRKWTDWGLEFINKMNFKNILDIGCGGGRAISKLANLNPNSTVYGIDYSKKSIDVSSSVNKRNRSFVEKLNMHYHSKEDLYNILNKAGFSNIKINENYKMGWLCAIAGK